MRKTVYLHIGRPKVGSTSLQHFLHSNADTLLRRGFLYPETGRVHKGEHHVSVEHGSHQLALVFLPGLIHHHLVQGVDAGQLYADLLAEIEQSSLSSVIISSENFWFVDPRELPDFFCDAVDVRILCYLRRQDDVALSSFVQEVALGQIAFDCDLREYLSVTERLRLLDYGSILDSWSEVFGDGNVIVRVYEEAVAGGSVEADLLRVLGLNPDDRGWCYDRVRKNPSLPLDALQVISELQIAAGAFADCAGFAEPAQELAMAFAALSTGERDDHHSHLFSFDQRAALLALFEASNERVARRYLGRENGALFPALGAVQDQPAYPGVDFSRYRTLIATIIASQHSAIQGLKSENGELRERLTQLEAAGADFVRELVVTNGRIRDTPVHHHPLLFRLEAVLNRLSLARLRTWRLGRRGR